MTIYYLAYGSNLHPLRLTERIPSTEFVGTLELQGYQLLFHKHGVDDSGKCNLLNTGNEKDKVYCALFKIGAEHKSDLDRFEGPGYEAKILNVNFKASAIECFAYFARDTHINPEIKPYDWYKTLVELGAKYQSFPAEYIEQISMIESIPDPDIERHKTHQLLIERILSHQ